MTSVTPKILLLVPQQSRTQVPDPETVSREYSRYYLE